MNCINDYSNYSTVIFDTDLNHIKKNLKTQKLNIKK